MRDELLDAFQHFLDSWAEYRSRQSDVPGFCISVMQDNVPIFSGAYGYANVEFRVPLTADHIFSMASQTKMFTAAAILILAQGRKLSLTDRASVYLPWLQKHPDREASAVTIEQLLSHSSGLAHDPEDASFWEFKESFPNASKLRRIILASHITPGLRGVPKYSNLGYCLLGEVIAKVSGQSYAAFVTEKIIAPLQLNATYADYRARLSRSMPNGYTVPYNQHRQVIPVRRATNALSPSVGVHATTDDMCRFIVGVLAKGGPILSARTQNLAQQTQASITSGIDAGVTFGLGFRVKHLDGHTLYGHDGHLAGHTSATFYDSEGNRAVSIAANAQNAPVAQLLNGVFRAMRWFDEGKTRQRRHGRFDVRLRNRMGSTEIVTNGKQIVAVDPDSWDPFSRKEEMRSITNDKFRITTPGSLIHSGEVVHYQFADDVIEKVNFSGITMMQEAAYYGQELAHATPAMAAHWLSLNELQYAALTAGRVVKVERSRGQFHSRILVDYGDDIGQKYAFLTSLPHGVPASVLLHKPVLGAAFTVWQFGRALREVVVLGLGMDQHVAAPFTSQHLLSLEPDPTQPRTVWASDALTQVQDFADKVKVEAFKFQALPEYEQDECGSAYGDSFYAWRIGKVYKAKALLRDARSEFWHKPVRQNIYHLIVTDSPPTPYQLWSIEFAKRVAAPRGETVYTLPRKSLEGVVVPDGDFTIWDDKQVALNGYNGIHWTHATIHDAVAGNDLRQFLDLKRKLLGVAQQYGTRIQ